MATQDTSAFLDPERATAFYEDRYRQGYMASWPAEKLARVAALLRDLPLPARGRVLDFGCGAGVFTTVLADALPGWEVVGADISATALATASGREPRARFVPLEHCEAEPPFDLVFSHHVLEHVPDIAESAALIARLIGPAGAMLHILPCGDPGSLEHAICQLRPDGLQGRLDPCFFFEEEGHLRRLTSARMAELWAPAGFRPRAVYFANQRDGAVEWLTSAPYSELARLTDPGHANDTAAALQLHMLRAVLAGLWLARTPQRLLRDKLAAGVRSPRDAALAAAALPLYPLSRAIDWALRRAAAREWESRRTAPGSEMYVFLARAAA